MCFIKVETMQIVIENQELAVSPRCSLQQLDQITLLKRIDADSPERELLCDRHCHCMTPLHSGETQPWSSHCQLAC